ncbi:cysteine desulfurase NifS [Candidatus Pacearchaeota archaeon CG10_big_fil_rev_8_21_14_0_10_31_24]|nr:MAG: cysteine desulfurase NifS [Candidatus Pacearchaeota archaeon CG10_big_fil_rev_8_21_14_0_10_31_24]
MNKIIYLDNNSTTEIYPTVFKEMQKAGYGNPSSTHLMGVDARKNMDNSRAKLAKEIGAKPWEIIFTSGASESNNLVIFGLSKAYTNKKKIIISSFEHASIYESCKVLKNRGYEIVEIPVDNSGMLDLVKLEKEINSNTLVVSIIHGHNELGVLQDIGKIGSICRKRGVLFHTDAVQSFGKEKIDVKTFGIDLLSTSGHKIGAPKGIGFLYIREGVKVEPLIYGGGQERGLRGGTENVLGIIGFSKALEIVKKVKWDKVGKMRDYFIRGLENLGGKINGNKERRLKGNVNVSFSGKDAEMLVVNLSQKGIMCSTRSACSEVGVKESRILKMMGLNEKEINGTLRFGLNEKIGKKEIDFVLKIINSSLG